ncbi:hypothetical protein RclHR1_00220045 [Rhizophagus clarus]|uniref:Uncharacterized protein n=1 Tax=Rhizophagus clarus TaxID=94130 RepID=A0A2Z6R9D9_9GLOM|nr:hypothetical protein RclHR1_00220045 [Rhizophagus clarus]GES84588.1 hypothetical protein RCL_e8788_RclHR1_00220045 [Rhizophagus clarus]
MIYKDGRINYLYVKSKSAFKTFFQILSKLAEQVKLHQQYKFENFMSKKKIFNDVFLNLLSHEPGTQKKGCKKFDIM